MIGREGKRVRTRSFTATSMPFFFSPAKKPRTVCVAQPVALETWAAVAPSGRRSMAKTVSCLVPSRGAQGARGARGEAGGLGRLPGQRGAQRLHRSLEGAGDVVLSGFLVVPDGQDRRCRGAEPPAGPGVLVQCLAQEGDVLRGAPPSSSPAGTAWAGSGAAGGCTLGAASSPWDVYWAPLRVASPP